MALDLVIDKLDAVAEPLRSLYQEKDGKFHLNVNGIEDTRGLKSALERTKTEAEKFKNENAAYRALGMTAEEIKTLKDAKDAAETEAKKKAGDFDGLLKQHSDKWAGEKATLEKTNADTFAWAKKATVDAGISAALAKAKATPEGIDLFMQILPTRVKFDIVNGSPHIQILTADGKSPLAGTGADGAATYEDLVKDAIKAYPMLFEGSGAGGGGAPSRGGRGAGSKTILRSEFEKIDPGLRMGKIREGFTVVDG